MTTSSGSSSGESSSTGGTDTTGGSESTFGPATTGPLCGNGSVEGGEACDDAGESATCDDDCTAASCGDGTPNATAGEECDDGNAANSDGCNNNCTSHTSAESLALGAFHGCALVLDTGAIRCFGTNDFGQLGYGHTMVPHAAMTPAAVGDVDVGENVASVATGGWHTCVFVDSGGLRCWGRNDFGQLGRGDTATIGDDELPSSITDIALGGTATAVALGLFHTCALMDTGGVRCWGRGNWGQLGYGNTATIGDDELPSSVGEVDVGGTVTSIVAGSYFNCALLDTGGVRCWGRGLNGALGYGDESNIGDNEAPSSAGDVALDDTALQIAAGAFHACALLQSGDLRCWGWNAQGELGLAHSNDIGDTELPNTEPTVDVGATVLSVAAGGEQTCALTQGDAVRCWGEGIHGLGYGTGTSDIGDDESPSAAGDVPVGGTVAAVAVGTEHICAILSDGGVRCWGDGTDGRLGYGDELSHGILDTPLAVGDVPL